ncbi:MAG TPA: hypothetical protein PKW55_02830 [Spirochaetota bacterium]|nr:hypothetical protein [Spirochaetota bacterium]HOM38216.1 hypothetical protein [Spirochaetota bacterium]HPQ48566.1 hypothetical protein [Spirochaetota bacterium]
MDLKQNARAIIKRFCDEKGIIESDAKVNDELWAIRFGSFSMQVYFFQYTHFNEVRDGIAIEGVLTPLPSNLGFEKEAELFKKLLRIHRALVGVKFAIDEGNNLIFSITRGLNKLDYDEFNEIMETIASQGDYYDDTLKNELNL